MKWLIPVLALVASVLVANAAGAQMGTATLSPLGAAPAATGPNAAVGFVGIPLGATELALPGLSPGGSMACPPTNGSTGMLFDGGGMTPGPSASCDLTSGVIAPMPAAAGAGRAAIPLGSTELASSGLSPPPAASLVVPGVAP